MKCWRRCVRFPLLSFVHAGTLGTVPHYAGHHCSWCYPPEGIRTKLLSAHVDDQPRWGDDPERIQLSYISRLIRNGEWFDGTHPFLRSSNDTEEHYAPIYIAQHPEVFGGILYPPSNGSKVWHMLKTRNCIRIPISLHNQTKGFSIH